MAVIGAVLLLAGGGKAQQFSPQELAFLREQFLEALADSIDGSFVVIGSMPPNRISGTLPASKITEADPLALAQIVSLQAQVTALEDTSGQSADDIVALTSDVAALVARVAALEARTSVWNVASVNAATWTNSFWATNAPLFSGSAEVHNVGYTNTLYFVSGSVVSNQQVGP